MNKLFFLLFLLFLSGVYAQDLDGVVKEKTLRRVPHKNWYKKGIKNYHPKNYVIETIKTNLEGVTVKVFFGSWCSDTQRELPRFFKILKLSGLKKKHVELIALDRKKESTQHLEKDYAIIYVPTFIFYRDGKALGRIIQQPIKTLEEDMYSILKGSAFF